MATRITAVFDVSTVLRDGVIHAIPEPISGRLTVSSREVALERAAWLCEQDVKYFREDNAELRTYLGELIRSAAEIGAEQVRVRALLEENLGEINRLQALKFEVR